MNKLFHACVLLIVTSTLSATTEVNTQHLADVLPTDCYFSAQFKQTREVKKLPVPLQSEGPLFFSCDDGLIWETTSPIRNTLIYRDDKQHFSWQPGHIPQAINDIANNNLATLLLGLLQSNTTYLEKKFSSHFIDENTVTLSPKQEGIEKYLRDITLSKQSDFISIVINNDTESTTIKIHSLMLLDQASKLTCQQSTSSKSCELLLDPIKNVSDQ